MHQIDLTLNEITKVEGAASLTVKVRDDRVEKVEFKVAEYKRFYTQAMRGKVYLTLPQLLARICGTCSNAHLLCSIESCEKALGIVPSAQSQLLKDLTMSGLVIRDHALHLYLFALPDIYKKDSFLDFDENNPEEYQLLLDGFEVKAAGNLLSTIVAGRSVHGVRPTIGGFLEVPAQKEVEQAILKLIRVRPAVLRLIKIFEECDFSFDRKTHYMALTSDPFGFLEGEIRSDKGIAIPEAQFRDHLEHVVIPYSQASGYTFEGESYMVGALARLNLSNKTLHQNTKKDAAGALSRFPSTNVFDNNLAQAIEILHCIDSSIDILRNNSFKKEPLVQPTEASGIGVGVIEAPRGTLYHKVEIGEDKKVIAGEIVVPTGQNQINIEGDLKKRLEEMIPTKPTNEQVQFEMEKLIRAYDPCMSCASHFLEINWE